MMGYNDTALKNESRMNSTQRKLHFEAKVISFFGSTFSITLCLITLAILAWYISRKKTLTFEQISTEDCRNEKNSDNSSPHYDDFSYLKAPVRNQDEHNKDCHNNRMEIKSTVYEIPTIQRNSTTQNKNNATLDKSDIYCNSMQHQQKEMHPHNSEVYANTNVNPLRNEIYYNMNV
ncbi:uncharacterized protein LOC115214262 [Argonauta hians]